MFEGRPSVMHLTLTSEHRGYRLARCDRRQVALHDARTDPAHDDKGCPRKALTRRTCAWSAGHRFRKRRCF